MSISSITTNSSQTATIHLFIFYFQLLGKCQEHSTPPDNITFVEWINEWVKLTHFKDENNFSLARSCQHRRNVNTLITLDNPYKYQTQIHFTTIMGFERLIHSPTVKKPHSINNIKTKAEHLLHTVLLYEAYPFKSENFWSFRNKTMIKNLYKWCLPFCLSQYILLRTTDHKIQQIRIAVY